MTERYPLRTLNRVAIASGAVAVGLILAANQTKVEQAPDDSGTPLPDTQNAVTKDCTRDPDAYQKFTLGTSQRLFVTAGLRNGELKNQDVMTISGTAQELTVTPYNQEGRTVFPDRLTPNLVEKFPFTTLGTVAIGRLNGEHDPSVILACDINELTQPGQPLDGQLVASMNPLN